jgi:hypothetical protein
MNPNLVAFLMAAGAVGGITSCLAQTTSSSSSSTAVAVSPGPKIQFAGMTFDFGKIDSGTLVKHEFVFTNTGSATLEIKDVKPGCGCTAAGTWDKTVEPGKTGIIPLQFNSTGFGGTVAKAATVTCNDPGQSNVVLHIKGTVWKALDVTPTMAVFTASSEIQTNETKIVRIVSNLEEPLELSDLQCTNRSFQTELKTVRPGKEFELRITAVPPFTSTSINAPVTLKTSSPKNPTISVTAYVMVQPTVMVSPNYLMLPQGPLTNAMHMVVAIQNNGTNSLVVSEPRMTVPGPEVHLKEIQPGRSFNLTVDFPAGFQAQVGQNVEVTAKSNHPKFPVITVHVSQPQPPAASVQPQAPAAAIPAPSQLSPLPVVPAKPASSVPAGK